MAMHNHHGLAHLPDERPRIDEATAKPIAQHPPLPSVNKVEDGASERIGDSSKKQGEKFRNAPSGEAG